MTELEKCKTCNSELSFDKVSNCKRCRACHPIERPPMPEISWSLVDFSGCDTNEQTRARMEEVARRNGWNPEKHIREENLRRYGTAL